MQDVTGYIVDTVAPIQNRQPTAEKMIASLGWENAVRADKIPEELSITCLDVYQDEDITFKAEGPSTFTIDLCLSGRGSVEIEGGVPYEVSPGNAILFSCDRYTKGYNHLYGGERVIMIDLRYEKSFLRRAGGRHLEQFSTTLLNEHCVPDSGAYMVGFPMTPSLMRCAHDIMNCTMEGGLCRDLYLRAKALEVLAFVIDFCTRACNCSVNFNARDRHKLDEARKLLENQFEKTWTIPLLAREVGLNEKKLKAGFRQIIGKTIHSYHRQVRMEAAASMLQEGMSVTQVAYATGFTSLSHFSKIFRDNTGLSPSDFARRA